MKMEKGPWLGGGGRLSASPMSLETDRKRSRRGAKPEKLPCSFIIASTHPKSNSDFSRCYIDFRFSFTNYDFATMAAPISNAVSDQPMLKADDRLAGLAHSEGLQIPVEIIASSS